LTISNFGQSLFFDNLKNSVWISETLYIDSTIKSSQEISLTKQKNKDEAQTDRTIWVFGDLLEIRHYNVKSRCVSNVSSHKYIADKYKGLLKIIFTDKLTLTYKIGIVSTGNHILLMRQKK
jgi:hypothetical protein